ncbi:hypothetical protein [Streptomyces nitrosporeus]|uniref:Uncharacterized protein n=1 Tax=Streptomyces nitrosporeus TaxID=28894 RepID=A0A5J6F4B5_9ACTN|nr:hypothetical protein [Streptomyces nitrosporeus]QEU71081.1 hypothetical protein CP967_03095 [Streptomyces nitrosporeus]GGZ14913.1 hypothetical protein GCM10010327_52360 [Streptomyces nitrosporeus]
MKHGVALAALFLVPALWGAADLASALTASPEVVCPGENVRGGEEHPGPMRPEDTRCAVLDGSASVGTRTYGQQRTVQSLERREDAVHGVLLLAYGAGGGLLVWRARLRGSRAGRTSRTPIRWSPGSGGRPWR